MTAVFVETLSLPLQDSAMEPSTQGPGIRAEPLPLELRLRRRHSESPSGRTWWLDVVVRVSVPDPEEVLRDCEYFLVDSTDGQPIGVVDRVELDERTGFVAAIEVAEGPFGGRAVRVDAKEIELLIPATERIVVRVPPEGFPSLDERSS
jgi:hypothetical protein